MSGESDVAGLIKAYLDANYKINLPDGWVIARPGEKSLEFDRYLAREGVGEWAFVTAANPRSLRLSLDDNRQRNAELRGRAASLGFSLLDAVGEDKSGDWPPEPSIVVLGLSRRGAVELGREFGQNAILYGVRGKQVELVWCQGGIPVDDTQGGG